MEVSKIPVKIIIEIDFASQLLPLVFFTHHGQSRIIMPQNDWVICFNYCFAGSIEISILLCNILTFEDRQRDGAAVAI